MRTFFGRLPPLIILLLLSCSEQPPQSPIVVRQIFRTAVEARRHVIGMLLISDAEPYDAIISPSGKPEEHVKPDYRAAYARAFLRTYTPRGGKKVDYILHESAGRELEIAEGLYLHGFLPEAHFHYCNILKFHPGSPQASYVSQNRRKETCEQNNHRTITMTTTDANIYARKFDLSLAALKEINKTAPTAETTFKEIACSVKMEPDRRDEQIRRLRDCRRKYPDSPYRAEAAWLLARLLSGAEEFSEARQILNTIAREPETRTHLAAAYLIAELDTPSLAVNVPSTVITTETLPLKVSVKNIAALRFSFAAVSEIPVPDPSCATTEEARKAISTALDSLRDRQLPTSFDETIPLTIGKREKITDFDISVSVKQHGLFRVTAEAKGLRCVFFVNRPRDVALEAAVFPAGSLLRVSASGNPVGGASLWNASQRMGTAADDGVVFLSSSVGGGICREHTECCRGCESCSHHHGGNGKAVSRFFVTSPTGYFHAETNFNPEEVLKTQCSPKDPLLLVYTDRPVYRAGDTIRFRGILRIPKDNLTSADRDRFKSLQGEKIAVTFGKEKTTLFQREYVVGEFGTFAGEFILPLSAHRQVYELSVECGKIAASRTIEVMDYRKSDFAILFTPQPGRLEVKAGYVWGDPVPGSRVICRINDKEVPTVAGKDGNIIIPAHEGDDVRVTLMRDQEELAAKRAVFHDSREAKATPEPKTTSPSAPERTVSGAPESNPSTPPHGPVGPVKAPLPQFTVAADKRTYGAGETITLDLATPWMEGEAWIILGDENAYDWRHIRLTDGRGKAAIPARGLHDPGTSVHVVFKHGAEFRIERCSIEVDANRLKIDIRTPRDRCRPGQEIDVVVKTTPGDAALSVGAVDEAVYMLREDDTADLHTTFYPRRKDAFAYTSSFTISGDPASLIEEPKEIIMEMPVCLNQGTYDMIGGGGGRYGSRLGGGKDLIARGGGHAAGSGAFTSTLSRLMALQKGDGSWEAGVLRKEGGSISQIGSTSLALLSFLGAGFYHGSKETYDGRCVGDAVRKGVQYLAGRQRDDGAIADDLLDHAIAALALSEAYGLSGSDLLRQPATKAIRYLAGKQRADGGWSRLGRGNDAPGEAIVSAFAVMALKSAQLSKIPYPTTAAAMADRFFNRLIDSNDGHCRTTDRPGAPSTATSDAAGMLSLILLRKDRTDPRVRACAARLSLVNIDKDDPDLFMIHLVTLSLFQFDGPSGALWGRWNEPMSVVLNSAIKRESLVPCDAALMLMSLEVYYRYAAVFGAQDRDADSPPLLTGPALRIMFPDTILWIPELRTDAAGNASFPLRLPDSITTTRLTLRGVTREHQFGQAEARVETSQPFFVVLKCPEFFVTGDESEIRTEMFNYTGGSRRVSIRLTGEGFVVKGPHQRTADVAGDDSISLQWKVAVTGETHARFAVAATTDNAMFSDGVVKTIPIRPAEPERIRRERGKTRRGGEFAFRTPPDERPMDLTLAIRPSKSPLAHILDALRYLNSYPHG